MTTTTSKIRPNGEHLLTRDGKKVGLAWRWPVDSRGKRKGGFGLSIDGWYWRKDAPSQRCGFSSTGVKTLREARELVDKVLGTPHVEAGVERAIWSLSYEVAQGLLDDFCGVGCDDENGLDGLRSLLTKSVLIGSVPASAVMEAAGAFA